MQHAGSEVFIIDDDPKIRTALARLIESAGYGVRTFASAGEFLDRRDELGPGCLLLDVRLPDLNGLDLQQRLQERGFYLPVIFMTGFGDIPTSVRAIKAGAFDFLTKPVEDQVLLRTIGEALEEEFRTRSERVETEELARRAASLTPREREVMEHVLAGLLNKQIAHELGISEKTVKVHRSRVMSKMGARRVATLVHYAVRLGMDPGVAPGAAGAPGPSTAMPHHDPDRGGAWAASATGHRSEPEASSNYSDPAPGQSEAPDRRRPGDQGGRHRPSKPPFDDRSR